MASAMALAEALAQASAIALPWLGLANTETSFKFRHSDTCRLAMVQKQEASQDRRKMNLTKVLFASGRNFLRRPGGRGGGAIFNGAAQNCVIRASWQAMAKATAIASAMALAMAMAKAVAWPWRGPAFWYLKGWP